MNAEKNPLDSMMNENERRKKTHNIRGGRKTRISFYKNIGEVSEKKNGFCVVVFVARLSTVSVYVFFFSLSYFHFLSLILNGNVAYFTFVY